tara:strand:+ start:764 stop:931 length:168 start_codon:yes stop_codon:yes gene_type:complete
MSEFSKTFKVGDVKKLKFGSKNADLIRKAAEKAGLSPNDYVKASSLNKAKMCKSS